MKHWRIAAKKGNVQIKKVNKEECDNDLLVHALKLLENDCFPIAIICCVGEEGKKEMWLTSLWVGIFDFLDGRRGVSMGGEEIWFSKMPNDIQNNFLDAKIASIWIRNC